MKRILSFILALTLLATVIPGGIVLAADGDISVGNGYIEVVSKADGSAFGINTLAGIPAKRFDDNKPLLYDDDDKFATSYTTIRIEKGIGTGNTTVNDYIYGSSAGTMTVQPHEYQIDGENSAIESVWSVDGVEVTQRLVINKNTASAHGGYATVSYEYKNTNPELVQVGIRILLDTKIADNDGGQFYKNGGSTPITKEVEYSEKNGNMPEWYSISDSLTYSTTTAYGLLKNSSMRRYPDKVQMAHWFNLANTMWGYEVNGSVNFDDYYNEYQYPDSAVAVIFEPEAVSSGQSLSVDTMYGVGELNGMESTSDYCVMTVTQKELLKANSDNTGYENNGEFTLYLNIDNSDKDSKQIVDGKLKLVFEDKLVDTELNMTQEPAVWVASEKEEDETISVGTINRGEIKREIPIKLKARPVYDKMKSNTDPDAPDIVYTPTEGYELRTSIDTRKISFQLTGQGTPIPSVANKIVTLPALGKSKVDIGFTGIDPKIIYYAGYSYFSVQGIGDNFDVLADKSNWTAYLRNVVTNKIINMDSFNCSADVVNKQLGLLVDMDGQLGQFELTIEFKGNLAYLGKKTFSDSSDYITSSDDEKYKNRGYSIAVIARTSDKNDYAMRLFSASAGAKPIEEQFEKFKEDVEAKKGEILMEGRGVFKVLYKDGKTAETSGDKPMIISTGDEHNPDIIGFETIPGSDNIKLNRIMYYNAMTPLTFKADFGSSGKPNVMRIEGDGDLSIINASTIWKHKFMIRMDLSDIYGYEDADEDGAASNVNAPQLQLLDGGWLMQSMGGLIFTLNYGELGCQDGRYTINFSGSVSFPLGMSKDEEEAAQSEGNTQTGETPSQTQQWKSAKPTATKWKPARPTNATPAQEEEAAAAETEATGIKKTFKDGNSATNSLGKFGDGGSLGVSVDSILFGEHEDRDDENVITTGFVGIAANVEIELPDSVFPAGGAQNNDSKISSGASAANPVANPIVKAGNHRATTAAGQRQNALNALQKNAGKMNGFSMGVSFNTYEFNAGVDLGIGIGPISSAFRMSLAETNTGKICLDTIYLEIRGFEIPIVPGVSSLKGLGGGISDLASSVNYKGDARPPVTVSVMAVFDLVKVMMMEADMSVSGNGLTFSITGAPAGFDQIKFVAKGEFDWTTGFTMKLSGTVDLFSGIVLGNVSLGLTTEPEFFMMGKINGSLNIPGLGQLAGVTLIVSSKFIAGGVKIFIFSGGFVYYYESNKFRLMKGSEVDEIEEVDLDSPELSPSKGTSGQSMSYLEVMQIPDENGGMQLMGIGSGAEVVGSTVDSYVSSSYSTPMTLGSPASFGAEVTDEMMDGKDVVLRVYYDNPTAPELKVTAPDGNVYQINQYDTALTQEKNNANGANMMLSEKLDDSTGIVRKYAYVTIANKDLKKGRWQIESINGVEISDYTVLTIPSIEPQLEIKSASLTSDNKLSAEWTADKNAAVSIALVPCDENGIRLTETTKDENGNDVVNEHPGYALASEKGSGSRNDIDINIPSGRYVVRMDSIVNNSMFTTQYTSEVLEYTNPNTIKAPEDLKAWAGGDGRLDVSAKVPEHATGVQFNVYKSNGEPLPAMGGYVGDYENTGEVKTYFKGDNAVLDDNGAVMYKSAIVPGESYYVEAYGVNVNEGSGYFRSPTVKSTEIQVPVPAPPQAKVSVLSYGALSKTNSKNVPYLQAGSGNTLVEYEITNMDSAPNNEVSVRFDINEKQYGDIQVNNAQTGNKGYAAFNLTDGEHFVDVVFINSAGDVTVETRKLSIDSIPADLKIEYPQNGSQFDPAVGIPIKLTTDDSVTIDIYLDDLKVVSGAYVQNSDGVYETTVPVLLPQYSHEVRITATDKNLNTTEHTATVVNKKAAQLGGIKIKANKPAGSDTTELTAVGLDADGNELGIDIAKSKFRWTLLTDPSEASMFVSDGNTSTVVTQNGASPFVVKAQLPLGGDEYLTDIYDSSAANGGGQENPGTPQRGGGSGGGIQNALPKEVQALIDKVKGDMSGNAEVKAHKMYSDMDFTAKQSDNAVFTPGSKITAENYVVIGTDDNTSAYSNGMPEGSSFRSDVIQTAALKELDSLLIDFKVSGAENTANLGVYKYSDSIQKWIYIGGDYDAARGMMSVYSIGDGKYAVIENPKAELDFVDIGQNWAELYIRSLGYAPLIDGYIEDGIRYFKPENEITRGEFVKMLASAKGTAIDGSDTSVFADSASIEDWAAPYACAAYRDGWFKGSQTENGIEAGLSDRITRQDAMTLVYRVFFEESETGGRIDFSDSSDVSEYAAEAVSYLTENEIVGGFEDGSLRPLDSLLREQIAKILWISILK